MPVIPRLERLSERQQTCPRLSLPVSSIITSKICWWKTLSFWAPKSLQMVTAAMICSDFGGQENKVCHCFHYFPIYLPWSDGIRWSSFSECWVLRQLFHSPLSFSIKRFFSSSSLSAIRVVSFGYLRLLIFLPAIYTWCLHPNLVEKLIFWPLNKACAVPVLASVSWLTANLRKNKLPDLAKWPWPRLRPQGRSSWAIW